MQDEIKKMCNDHWAWVNGFLETIKNINYTKESVEYIYKTAFEHGAKHAEELINEKGSACLI